MRHYIGLIHKDADSDFGVSFPDFPGVATAGVDLDDARHMAEDALAFHVDGMIEDREAIPEPSSLEAIMSEPENRDGVAILVSLKTESKKAVRLNITLQEDFLKEIDAYAEARGLTRSGFLARAAKHEMAQPEEIEAKTSSCVSVRDTMYRAVRLSSFSLIPALVAGIQRSYVRRVKNLFQPKDLGLLDTRHKGVYEGRIRYHDRKFTNPPIPTSCCVPWLCAPLWHC